MANKEIQKLIVEKLASIEATMATKDDIARLDTKLEQYGQAQQDDVKGLLELIDKKLDRIAAAQVTQGESIHILARRQLQTEAELAALKKGGAIEDWQTATALHQSLLSENDAANASGAAESEDESRWQTRIFKNS